MKLNNKKGISLIVLVITIIVMIILAAAIILSLQSSGIIGRANEAKTKSDAANAKQVLAMASANWQLGERDGYSEFKPYAESKLNEAGYATGTGKNKYFVTDAGSVIYSGNNTLYVDANGKHAVIPEGFIVSDKTTEDTIAEGLVIYEGTEKASTDTDAETTRNQFVWIPVDNISEFVRKDGYMQGTLQDYVSKQNSSEPFKVLNDTTGENAEYTAMKDSVEKYGGFYLGRYETGTTAAREEKANGTSFKADGATPDVLVQKSKKLYNYVGWGVSMTEVTGNITFANYNNDSYNQGKGAVELSRGLYNTSSIKSTLCYGVQWDATMNYLSDVENPNATQTVYPTLTRFIENSFNMGRGMGCSLQNLSDTGSYSVKNIYDIAGNAWEWTMEACSDTTRFVRGGDAYDFYLDSAPASCRYFGPYGGYINECTSTVGFRITLYLV